MTTLASINVEGLRKHQDRVFNFLNAHMPEILCLQELAPEDIPAYENLYRQKMAYVRVNEHSTGWDQIGLGLIATQPLQDVLICDYTGNVHSRRPPQPHAIDEMLIFATIGNLRVGTTHVRVTDDGESTPEQMASIEELIPTAQRQADLYGGLLLCGDFNAPRGNPAFSRLAEVFLDGVPPGYHTSLDPQLHRIGYRNLSRMVDGLFHTPSYRVGKAKLHTGVSDHCAVFCHLTHAQQMALQEAV